MSNQLGVLQSLYPYSVLFPKSCDLSIKPPASCVPASILRSFATLTLHRRTVTKDSDEGVIRPPNSPSNSGTNSTGISSAAIAGVVIGCFAFGILVTFIAYVYWRRRRMAQAAAANPSRKVEESSMGGMTYPMPWVTHSDGTSVTTSSPSPRRQKDGQYYQTPPTRHEDSGDAPASAEGTSRSPPSYLAATSYAGSG